MEFKKYKKTPMPIATDTFNDYQPTDDEVEAYVASYSPSSNINIKTDNVNSPAHYNLNRKGIECIDAIEAALTLEEFRGYLKGNILKYTWRERYKNGQEDVEKANWYNNKLVETGTGEEN